MPLMSRAQYGRHRRELGLPGGSAPSITYAIRDGRITITRDGKIDSELADKQWAENTSPAASRAGIKAGAARAVQILERRSKGQGPRQTEREQYPESEQYESEQTAPEQVPETDVNNFAKSRSAREYYEAELARLKFAEKQGSLIPAKTVKKILYEAGRIVRAGHEGIVAQLAPALASEVSIPKVERILKQALDKLDNTIADAVEQLDSTLASDELQEVA